MGKNATGSPLLTAQKHQSKGADVPDQIRPTVRAISAEMVKQGILEGTKARVCVVLDVSASMVKLYTSGKVQSLLNKSLAMAHCLGGAEVKIFPFGKTCHAEPVSANFHNFQTVIKDKILSQGYQGATNYAAAVCSVRKFYFNDTTEGQNKYQAETPVFVIFATDGAPNNELERIHPQFKASSHQPVFWKIIALGGKDFQLLQEIDDAPVGPGERLLDNSDYKLVRDPSRLTPRDLVEEFPQYLFEAFNRHHLLTLAPVLDEKIIEQNADRVGERRSRKGCCVIA